MRDDTSPTSRALLTLELVQNRPGITGDEIAERLGVTSRAARRYVAILREADLFVTHAGMGGCGEGLLTATPMIAVPQDVDQFANADTLVGLGVARRLDTAEASAAALRSAGDELLADREVAARLAELAHAARAEGGTSRAADLIEAELR